MRIERWFWLPIFCVVSLIMHFTLAYVTKSMGVQGPVQGTGTIEVVLEPLRPTPVPKPEAKPILPKPKPRPSPSVAHGPRPAVLAPYRVAVIRKAPSSDKPEQAAAMKLAPMRVAPQRIAPLRVASIPSTALVPRKVPPEAIELPDLIKAEAPQAGKRVKEPLNAPPRLRVARNDPRLNEGGGSPSPSPILGGHEGLNAPESPKEDVNYTGGGKGGQNLPDKPALIGGGGGKSVLSVKGDNPLGDGIPDEKPGSGPGAKGGNGSGMGGGNGSAAGPGIGARADGKVAIGSLRRKPGTGIGEAPSGSAVGTRPPGGGRGRGAELPGTGGTGNGYGRGHGSGIGDGSDDSAPPARMRGVPFGNVAGLLGGGDGGGGRGSGAPGRGAVFGARQAGGNEGATHIVYALDISGSMRDGHKIDKAKEALKKALSELRRSDTFNIVVFKRDASTFREDSVSATPANVANAISFVNDIRIGDGTNISQALDLAFGMNGITHIYLMTDGEPNGGIGDFNELRRFIRERNTHGIRIMTLALGLGENFPGMRLLKGIAEDNRGTYDYINLSKIAAPSN